MDTFNFSTAFQVSEVNVHVIAGDRYMLWVPNGLVQERLLLARTKNSTKKSLTEFREHITVFPCALKDFRRWQHRYLQTV